MEDKWISDENNATRDDQSEENLENPQGTLHDLYFGLIFGFFLGLIALIWMLEKSSPRKLKYGIFSGILINFAFSIIRLSLPFLKYL
jgi:hypothetical protein